MRQPEKLPWPANTKFHSCPRSGGHQIACNADGTCPKGCHKDRKPAPLEGDDWVTFKG